MNTVMDNNRPRGREKNVTGPGKSVRKRGQGLGTGPVGDAGGYKDRTPQGGGARGPGSGGGGMKLIVLLLALLLGGGGGLTALFGGLSGSPAQTPSTGQQQSSQGGGTVDWTQLLGGLGGGSVSTGWQSPANTGRLDTTVAANAREKYTKLLGGSRDTATIMVYMCGTDLESRSGMGTADLQEMLNARFGDNINLLVYTGGCKGWKNNLVSSSANQIWQVKNGQLVCLEKNLGSQSMTDPSVLSGYIQWCAGNYPASRYELILWDHGGGSVSGYGYDEKFASTGSMSLAGVDAALKSAGVKFDFIGFDACLMATAETALTLTQYADYLIASEETEPGVGWYYTNWLTAFGKNTSIPTVELGRQIVDSFVDTCAEKCRGQLTTLSVVDLAELEATLPSALSEFSRSTTQLIRDKQYQTVSNARSGAREFAQSSRIDQVDLVHLAKNLGTKEGEALAKALLGQLGGGSGGSADDISAILMQLLGGSFGRIAGLDGSNSEFLSDRALGDEELARYLAEHRFPSETLLWQEGTDGVPVIRLTEEQWGLVHALELNLFYDDGEGYIDLGLDNVYQFDGEGGLLGVNDNTWLAVNGQPVAYYHTATVDDGTNYTITGRVPVLHNGVRSELLLTFDNHTPHGYVAGVRTVYPEGETDTVAKGQEALQPGDTLEFLCDYYGYDGAYQDNYLLGEALTVPEQGLTISDVPLEGATQATYRFTDLYGRNCWTAVIP